MPARRQTCLTAPESGGYTSIMTTPFQSASLPPVHATHTVQNQAPPFVGHNLYTIDRTLSETVAREGGGWAHTRLSEYGALMGSAQASLWASQANENPPVLHTHDRYGNRRDEVLFHPAWHSLMEASVRHEVHALPWREPREGAHVARAAMLFIAAQTEYGHLCPIAMTYSVIPALRMQPEIAAEWEPRIVSNKYDGRFLPSEQKTGALCGMAMTEKQGGSDVRMNTTRAVALGAGGPGGEYALTGHKWFCSAPMCDLFLVLAYTDKGLSCFAVPRFLPDGTRNRFFLQRLKNKLGNKSNASSEVEFDGTWGRMVGGEGRGVPTIIEMANHTRLDCVLGSAGSMRQALNEAFNHCTHRIAFGRPLYEQPLMRNVLADLAIESQAATLLAIRLARAFDRQSAVETEGPFRRMVTAAAKYFICKRTPTFVFEAMECLGGAGYVEESPLPRLFRETPLNSIWEGSGNVMCLDVLRAMSKDQRSFTAVLDEIKLGLGQDQRLDQYIATFESELGRFDDIEVQARRFVERLILALQGSLLVRYGNKAVADAFCATRIAGDWGRTMGTLPGKVDFTAILNAAKPPQ